MSGDERTQRTDEQDQKRTTHEDLPPCHVDTRPGVARTRALSPDLSWSERFAAAWPTVERRVLRDLTSRGWSASAAQDMAQTAAERAIGNVLPFNNENELASWCLVVARRAAIDEHRRMSKAALVAAYPEIRASDDQARDVEMRALVDEVLAAAARLPAGQRDALFAEQPAGERQNVYLRRHRARSALRAVVTAFGSIVLGLRRRFERSPLRASQSAAAALAVPIVFASAMFVTSSVPRSEGPALRALASAGRPGALHRAENVRSYGPSPVTKDTVARRDDGPSSPRTFDSPITPTAGTPTPAGNVRVDTENRHDQPELVCLFGPGLKTRCVDYPVRP